MAQINDGINRVVSYVKHLPTDQLIAHIAVLAGIMLIVVALVIW